MNRSGDQSDSENDSGVEKIVMKKYLNFPSQWSSFTSAYKKPIISRKKIIIKLITQSVNYYNFKRSDFAETILL